MKMWGKNQGIPNSSAGDLPTVSEFLLLGWSKNAKWKCFRVAEQLQLRERTCTTRNARNVNLSVDLSLISNSSIPPLPAYVLACHVHKFAVISIPKVLCGTFKERCWWCINGDAKKLNDVNPRAIRRFLTSQMGD